MTPRHLPATALRVREQEQEPRDLRTHVNGFHRPERGPAVDARHPCDLFVVEHPSCHRDPLHGLALRGSLRCALGRLHELAATPWTGGGVGSRAEEVKNSRRWVQGPAGYSPLVATGVVGRALDAAPEPVTLTGRREAAHPTQAAAA